MGKIKTQKRLYVDNLNKFGIFAAFLLVTVFSVWFYSPIIGSHADESSIVNVTVGVQPVISLVLDTNELNFNLRPVSSGTTSQSKTVTATVKTNDTHGYQLYFSSEDESSDMTSTTSSAVISSLQSRDSSITNIPGDKNGAWGYSKTGGSSTWNPIPLASSPDLVRSIFYSNANYNSDTKLYIGVAARTGLMSGVYSKNVKFSAVINGVIDNSVISSIAQMQQMTPEICSETQVGAATTLVDSRDGEEYTVRKYGDGQCWMAQDLRLTGEVTLTSVDSDVANDFILPEPIAAGSGWDSSTGNTPVSKPINIPRGDEGLGYNYFAASAGTISNTTEDLVRDATSSICPKGWTLPTAGQWTNFLSVNDITNDERGVNMIQSEPFNFVGIDSSFSYYNYSSSSSVTGYYWASSGYAFATTESPNRRIFNFYKYGSTNSIGVSTSITGHSNPSRIRCIARTTSSTSGGGSGSGETTIVK